MKHGVLITCVIGLLIAAGAYAQDGSTNAPPHRPMRPMMDSLLGPRALEALALTGDQQTKYGTLNASFKSDVAKWRANHPSGGASTNAVPGAARHELRELRQGYIQQLRAVLTADQNAKLTQLIENGPRGRQGGGPGEGGNPPPAQPPPPANNP